MLHKDALPTQNYVATPPSIRIILFSSAKKENKKVTMGFSCLQPLVLNLGRDMEFNSKTLIQFQETLWARLIALFNGLP